MWRRNTLVVVGGLQRGGRCHGQPADSAPGANSNYFFLLDDHGDGEEPADSTPELSTPMQKLSRSVCLSCQLKRASVSPPLDVFPRWQSVRFLSAADLKRRRKPARTTLSADVSRSSTKKPSRRVQDNPFGGMNQTKARIGDTRRPKSQSQLRRSHPRESEGDDKKEAPLFKALKMQTALSPVPYSRRMNVKSKLAEITSFTEFPLLPAVQDSIGTNALPGLKDIKPTHIQRLAIPALLQGNKSFQPKSKGKDGLISNYDQYLLAAETGSGKTLAYLLPLVDAMKRGEVEQKKKDEEAAAIKAKEEEQKRIEREKNNVFEVDSPELTTPDTHPDIAKPRALILVPTSELVTQIGFMVKQLSYGAKYRSALLSSSQTPRRIRNSLFNPAGLDLLVTTPHLLSSIAESNPYILSRVQHIVVDEADSMFDRSFFPITSGIIERSAPSLKQLILCSATIPRSMDNLLRERFPDIRRLVTPNIHAIPRRVQLGVVDVHNEPYRGNKSLACADVLWSLGKAGNIYEPDLVSSLTGEPQTKHVIVFVNERETADEVAKFLSKKGIDALSLTRDTPDKRQAEILADFTFARPPPSDEDLKLVAKSRKFGSRDIGFAPSSPRSTTQGTQKKLSDMRVLVVTDLGSRGIDTVAVKTVILYDVPHSTVDFIHRLGRVGRMGRRGRGIVLVDKNDRKDVVKEVREAMFRGQALI